MLNNIIHQRCFSPTRIIECRHLRMMWCLLATSRESSSIFFNKRVSTLVAKSHRSASSTAVGISDRRVDYERHCDTCRCEDLKEKNREHTCHDEYANSRIVIPKPPPQPKFSYHRRILPSSLTQLSSPQGKILFRESLLARDAEAYFPLSEQFINQSEPAYCAVASLIMVLNAFGIDPNLRWKGGWRWFGSEEMILKQCCISADRVKQVGILLEEFASLGRCQGLTVHVKRPISLDSSTNNSEENFYELEDFRKDLIQMVRNPPVYEAADKTQQVGGFLVVSFSRKAIGQTGDGHYSPIAAYHEPTDQCLVMDVARFKYAPFWVSVKDLYEATRPIDSVTNKSRGWFLIYPIQDGSLSNYPGSKTTDERKKPAHLVPTVDETLKASNCPFPNK